MATTKVFVGSLPQGTKPEELRHLFEDYGVVVECDVMNRCGFVHMETKEMANTAIAALNSSEFKGQMIVVELGRPKDKKSLGGNANESARGGGRGGNIGARGGGRGGPAHGRGGRGGGLGNRGNGPSEVMLGIAGVGPNFGTAIRGVPKNKFGLGGGGPMRNDKQQRTLPYQRRNPQNNFNGPGGGGGSGKFGNNQRGNLNNNSIVGGSRRFGRFGADGGQPSFQNFKFPPVEEHQHFGSSGGMNNFADNDCFASNFGGNDEFVGNFGGNDGFSGNFGGNSGFNMVGGFGGKKGMAGQDRRGFALSSGGRGGGQGFGGNRDGGGGFGGQNNAGLQGNSEVNLFRRRNTNGPEPNMNNGLPSGGFRGDFGNGRGRGPSNVAGRGGFRHDGMDGVDGFLGQNSYKSNFPPLGMQGGGSGGVRGGGGRGGGGRGGARGGGMQRNNGPRQSMMLDHRF